MNPPRSIGGSMAHGIGWMVLYKVLDRAVGLVSVIMLARLLVPADFGLVALATSGIAFLEVFGAFGLDTALIQRADARRDHFDAVWTFNVLVGLLTGVAGVCLAWPLAAFYGDDRLVSVVVVLAITRMVHGFENVGVIAFRKELEFDREFRFLVAKRLANSLLITLPLAWIFRSYWALLVGAFTGSCIAVVLSYALHPFRPRRSLRGIGQLMTFSKWLYFTGLVEFVRSRMSDLIVGRWTDAAAVGSLAMARDVARFPTQELSAPVNRAVFPGYVKLAGDRGELQRNYLKVTSVLVLLILPAGVGLCLLAEPVTRALLGDKWISAVPLIQLLAINGILNVLLAGAHHVNLAIGMSRSTSIILAVHVAITLPLLLWSVPIYGTLGAAMSILAASAVTAPLNFLLLGKAIRFGRTEVVALLGRPLLGTAALTAVVLALMSRWAIPAAWPAQIAYIAMLAGIGALVYFAVVYLLWRRRGDPEAAEAWALRGLRRMLAANAVRFGLRP